MQKVDYINVDLFFHVDFRHTAAEGIVMEWSKKIMIYTESNDFSLVIS